MKGGKVLVDGDIIAYRCAFSKEKDLPEDVIFKVDKLMSDILDETCIFPFTKDDYQVYLTGKGNFRYDVAKTAGYKANRKGKEKPKELDLARDWLTISYGAVTSEGEEADDLIAKEATNLGPSTIVASVDKDMLQIPCYHFNIFRWEWDQVSDWEGLKHFYTQILTGDTTDNIIGLHRVGPKTAAKMLKDCNTEVDLWETCLKAYDGNKERVIENGRLLWLRRKEGELWEPPASEDNKP
jgi:5'-3' exonuclease|tara:strand:+ start:240 stop:956 length:717 start_codon:yes stop_codon:yes gene_type:complete